MFACCKMEGVSVVFAPLGAELGSAIGEGGFTLVCNRMTIAAGRTGPGDVDDLDDVRQAQFAHTTFLAQGVVSGIEILVDTEDAGSDGPGVGFGTVGVGVGTIRNRVGLRRSGFGRGRGRTWMVGFGGIRVSITNHIHIHVYRV